MAAVTNGKLNGSSAEFTKKQLDVVVVGGGLVRIK